VVEFVILKWWFGDGEAWIWVKVDSWWLQEATACKQMVEAVRWFLGSWFGEERLGTGQRWLLWLIDEHREMG
jgi:hypothetical protein